MVNKAWKEKKDELESKYHDKIVGISDFNDVDMGVAFEMLKTNALEGTAYGGGGVNTREEWDAIVDDFKAFEKLFVAW